MQNPQRGFTLVGVLLLTTMASIVVFTSLKDTVVQERLSGNYQKSINARMMAERAVFDQIDLLQTTLNDNPSAGLQDLIDGTASVNSQSQYYSDLKYSATLNQTSTSEFYVAAYGERFDGDALSNIIVRYSLEGSAGTSTFTSAIVGCEGVSNDNGGLINSYDSSLNGGVYSDANATVDATIRTIVQDSDIVISGGAITWGDLLATGSIEISGGAFVGGTVYANGDVVVDGGTGNSTLFPSGYPSDTRIGGDLYTKGDLEYQGGSVLGHVRVEGDVFLTSSFAFINQNNDGEAILYGGTNIARNGHNDKYTGEYYTSSIYQQSLTLDEVEYTDTSDPNWDATDPDTNCDPISIASEMTTLAAGTPRKGLAADGWSKHASLSTSGGLDAYGNTYTPQVETIAGVTYNAMYYLDELDINGAELTISGGDVAVYIKGDFNLTSNGNSQLTIEDGSSLTVFVEGKTEFKKPANIARKQITDSNIPPFSVYSSYESSSAASSCNSNDVGVSFKASSDVYVAVYAPLTNVVIDGAGSLSGSVRGKTVQVCGSGDIHYDTALAGATGGSSSGSQQLVFQGLSFTSG